MQRYTRYLGLKVFQKIIIINQSLFSFHVSHNENINLKLFRKKTLNLILIENMSTVKVFFVIRCREEPIIFLTHSEPP
jgi:hypothetical protein